MSLSNSTPCMRIQPFFRFLYIQSKHTHTHIRPRVPVPQQHANSTESIHAKSKECINDGSHARTCAELLGLQRLLPAAILILQGNGRERERGNCEVKRDKKKGERGEMVWNDGINFPCVFPLEILSVWLTDGRELWPHSLGMGFCSQSNVRCNNISKMDSASGCLISCLAKAK